jgi:hypothetical protein
MKAYAGSKKAEKNLKLDEEKARAGSKQKMKVDAGSKQKMVKEVLPTPVPFGFRLSIGQVEGGESKAGAGKRRKKVLRLGKASSRKPLPLRPPYQPLPF